MNNINKKDFVNCRHCKSPRDISEQKYCSQCGGKELWQSKPESQKNVFELTFSKIIRWADGSILRTFLVFFIGLPLVLVLILRIFEFLFGFEIIFK